jgi:hypothetical protein
MYASKVRRNLAAIIVLVVAWLAIGGAEASAAPYCGIRWGSLPEVVSTGSDGELFGVRAGRHPCFDRLVLDVDGDVPGYFVRYVGEVTRDGSGDPVPLRGGARLQVIATVPAIPSDSIFLANGELIDTAGYRTFRHVAWAGSFEGQTTIGLGVRARLPFRVFLLDGPGTGSRLVIDVAHRW